MKIYTKTGDAGTTSLVGGERVSKADIRLDAYGTVDELNAIIGLLVSLEGVTLRAHYILVHVQNKLFTLGCELATNTDSKAAPLSLVDDDVAFIEKAIDEVEEGLPVHRQFILPGGTTASSVASVARTVCRRCERRMVEMTQSGLPVSDCALKFINRLSDYLFVLSRRLNIFAGKQEFFWNKDC